MVRGSKQPSLTAWSRPIATRLMYRVRPGSRVLPVKSTKRLTQADITYLEGQLIEAALDKLTELDDLFEAWTTFVQEADVEEQPVLQGANYAAAVDAAEAIVEEASDELNTQHSAWMEYADNIRRMIVKEKRMKALGKKGKRVGV